LWNAPRFERELATLRRELGLGRAHILGQSWGTMLAVDHALAGATGIASMVLSSPCLSVSRWRDDADELLAAMPDAEREAIAHARDGAYDTPAYQAAAFAFSKRHLCRLDPWPAMLDGGQRESQGVHGGVGPDDFEATGDVRDHERVGSAPLSMPVLYLCGHTTARRPEPRRGT
jgi:proline iminopeptidase